MDHNGTVFLMTFSKFLRWTVNALCILKPSKKIGQIYAISVLRLAEVPTVRAAIARAEGNAVNMNPVQVEMSDASCLALAKAGTLIALSATTSTFIIATDPDPVVLFRWDRPVGRPPSNSLVFPTVNASFPTLQM